MAEITEMGLITDEDPLRYAEYSYPRPKRLVCCDEIPPMSTEWCLREVGMHDQANSIPGPSWLDYAARRREKAFWHPDL